MNKLTQTSFVLTLLLLCTTPFILIGESNHRKVGKKVTELVRLNTNFAQVDVVKKSQKTFDEQVSSTVSRYTLISLKTDGINKILNEKPEFLRVSVPLQSGNSELLLYAVDISPNGFTLETSDGKTNPSVGKVAHYRGIINGDLNSVVSMSFSHEETMGLISNDYGNFVLGKIADSNTNDEAYVLYNDKDLIPSLNYTCGTNTDNLVQPYHTAPANPTPGTASAKCVNWYYEIDYDVFVGKGSLANVNSYIQGVFNQVATLYDNDGISITLQTVYVWTSTDPYTGPTTSDFLNQFGSYRTSFAGDLANLVGYAGSGGVAYINGLCSSGSQFRMGYTGISSSYNTVPTYSWTVEVITHEDGHLLGSRHTHDCVWNGNNTRIDGCGPQAGYPGSGSCGAASVPASGTIMSYCHLVGGVGINFNNGFGTQPTALILNNVNNASCLSACSSCPTPGQPASISGATSYCQSTSQTYSVSAVSGATSYIWNLPSGWTGTSTTNSITVTTSGSGGVLSVTASNSCGDGPARTLTVSGGALPSQPGNLSGNTTVCQGVSQTYSVPSASGATSYQWTLPNGWTGTSTTNSITVVPGSGSGNVSVRSVNGCGNSAYRTVSVSTNSTPSTPLAVSGESTVCSGTSYVYSVPTVSGATSYTWTLPNGWTGSSTSNSITVISGVNDGNITVTASNACGTSAASTSSITHAVSPARPKSISTIGGHVKVCPGDVISYSILPVSGTTSYTWTPPPGATITSGQGTINISVSYNSGFVAHDTLKVIANNGCAESDLRFRRIFRNTPGKPSIILGPAAGNCNVTGVAYQVNNIPGMTYNWNINHASAIISNGQGTNAIAVDYGSQFTNATMTVTAQNNCGTSNIRSLKVKQLPAQPNLINGTSSPCVNQQGVPYSIDPVYGATSYTWSAPTGARINDGAVTSTSAKLTTTSTSVTINFKTTDGIVKVKANSPCGAGPNRKMDVTFACRVQSNTVNIPEVSIYPNPASDEFRVLFNSNENNNYNIRLTDLAGKLLQFANGATNEGENSISLNVSDLVKGIYLVETTINGHKETHKLVIQ